MDFFDYFLIISLAVYLAIFFGRTFGLRSEGIGVIHMGSGKKGFAAFLEKSFFVFFPLWLFEILSTALHGNVQILSDDFVKPIISGMPIQVAGLFVICISIILFITALVSFKTSWRVGIDQVNPGELITDGIFSVSRNPVFLSMDLFFLGTFLIAGNLFFLISFIAMALGFHFQIIQEEMFLLQKYGKNYQTYMARVNRYI